MKVCGSDNLAPTAVPAVDLSLLIIDEAAQLDGSASTDPESDTLDYSWILTSKPPGSMATLVNAFTATPTLTPDMEGNYQVT